MQGPSTSLPVYSEGDKFGGYRLEELLEEDPTGRIFRAYEETLFRSFCLKLLSGALHRASGFADVLRIQLQAAESLNHPGIVVHELAKHEDQIYLASEWTADGWLSHLIVQKGRFRPFESIQIVMKCAEILNAASRSGIIHGNLKPSNILIYPGLEVKIAEIGFAAAARVCFGAENLPVYLGATRFLAPEMTEGGTVDFRADIYSLGTIFYYLLFNTVPFRLDGQKLTVEEDLADPIADEVLEVISQMTERNRDNRYRNYGALLDDLKKLQTLHTQAIEAPAVKNFLGGGIKSQNIFKLLCAIYTSGVSGILTVTHEDIQRKFYILNKTFVFFESNRLEDSIWSWLVTKKEIDFHSKPNESSEFQASMNLLLAKGTIKLEDFKYRYQQLINGLLFDCLKWPAVDAEFMTADIENEPIVRIQLSDVLFKAAKQCVAFPEVVSELKADMVLHRTPLFESLISSFKLNTEESILASQTQDGVHIGTLLVTAGSVPEIPMRFLYLLKQIGALESKSVDQHKPWTQMFPETPPDTVFPNEVQTRVHQPSVSTRQSLDQEMQHFSSGVRMEIQTSTSKIAVRRLDEEAERRYEQAKEKYDQQKYWEAANLCEQALGLHENARYYWLMGLSYSRHPKFRMKAEDCFHHAIHLDPINDELHVGLARFYMSVGLFLRAKTHCEMAMKIVPEQLDAKELLQDLVRMNLGVGGCPCEHKPGCHHHH